MTETLKNGAPRGEKREGGAPGGAPAGGNFGGGGFGGGERRGRQPVGKMSASGKLYVDYKENESLRRMTAANGKINSRRRTGATALEQRMLSEAIKRARYMALLPYVAAAP